MPRPLSALLLLPLTACFDKTPDTGDTGPKDTSTCAATADAVAPGVYGGAHYQLTVKADGSAELLGDCSLATVDATPVSDRAVHWVLSWQSGNGLPVQDTAEIVLIDVALDGTYCGTELAGTLTFPDGTTAPVDVVLDQAAEIYACQ